MMPPDLTSPEYVDWAMMNTIKASWIFVILDSSLLPYVLLKDNVKAL